MENKITLKDLPNYGKIMKLKDFIKSCVNGWLINEDGHGRYVGEFNGKQMMTDIFVWPTDILDGNIKNEYKLIIWFNK